MPRPYDPTTHPPNVSRRPELAQDDGWIREFLARAAIGHVASQWEGQPFLTPTTFWYDSAQHRIVFHSNVAGRVRANLERDGRVAFEASEAGRLLPSNVALEFSIQYASVIAFGRAEVLSGDEPKRQALYGLIGKYFPTMAAGREYRPITGQELKRTSVYAIHIESWSGKQNWPEAADQSGEWPPLPEGI